MLNDITITFRSTWAHGMVKLNRYSGSAFSALGLDLFDPIHPHELWIELSDIELATQPGVMQFVCIRSIEAPFLRKRPAP